jgi:Bacterial protein of unknown function (DUF853)
MADLQQGKIYLGSSAAPELSPQYLALPFANRHGLIAGATGTGKTVSLQVMAEGFSSAGVLVFCADIKGDLAGLATAGEPKDFLLKRATEIGFAAEYKQAATQRITREVTRTVTGRVVGGVAAELGRQVGGSVGGSVGRAIIRGVLGGMLR